MKLPARRRRVKDRPEIPIAPMIDCVFLMLVYFMTTSSLERSEADLSCPLAGSGVATGPVPAVDEQRIRLSSDGRAHWNGMAIAVRDDSAARREFSQRLQQFDTLTRQAGSTAMLLLLPDPDAPHDALIRLLDAVSASGIESVELR